MTFLTVPVSHEYALIALNGTLIGLVSHGELIGLGIVTCEPCGNGRGLYIHTPLSIDDIQCVDEIVRGSMNLPSDWYSSAYVDNTNIVSSRKTRRNLLRRTE